MILKYVISQSHSNIKVNSAIVRIIILYFLLSHHVHSSIPAIVIYTCCIRLSTQTAITFINISDIQ